MGNVTVGKYLYYQPEKKRFYLTDEAEQIVYSKKDLIPSHSGASEWAHSMFCQTLDFYGGTCAHDRNVCAGSAGKRCRISPWASMDVKIMPGGGICRRKRSQTVG